MNEVIISINKGFKGIIPIVLAGTVLLSFPETASTIQVGKTIVYQGGKMGKVIFDGTKHNDAGYHCLKCHNTIFITKKGSAKMLYSHHVARKEYCFVCHNGSRAFDATGNCYLCHKKKY